jgi:DNA-binding FadR family transcriptional regulator
VSHATPSEPSGRLGLRRSRISHLVAVEIVRDIVQNGLQSGDRLPTEAAMLEEFDVGRASLREALRLLEGFGLIAIRQGQNGGPVVTSLRPEDLSRTLSFYFHTTGATYGELMEARLLIEPAMARLAAERREDVQMQLLRTAMEAERTAPFENPMYILGADRFHHVVSGISGNRVLDLLGQSLRVLYQGRLLLDAIFPKEERTRVRAVHQQIGEAILSGQGDEAEQLMRAHLEELTAAQWQEHPGLRGERVIWTE